MSQDAFEVLADRLMELGAPELAKLVRSPVAREWLAAALLRAEKADGYLTPTTDYGVECISCFTLDDGETTLHDAPCSWAAFRREYSPQYREWELGEAWRQALQSEACRKAGRASAAKRAKKRASNA